MVTTANTSLSAVLQEKKKANFTELLHSILLFICTSSFPTHIVKRVKRPKEKRSIEEIYVVYLLYSIRTFFGGGLGAAFFSFSPDSLFCTPLLKLLKTAGLKVNWISARF